MPLPMVHLAVAVRCHTRLNGAPTPAFLLGSIAPDAVHVRPQAGRGDKWRTHLYVVQLPETLGRLRTGWLVRQGQADGPQMAAFAQGYALHLLADRLWYSTIMPAFRRSMPPQWPRRQRIDRYYQETHQLDRRLYHSAPWRAEVWDKLARAQPVDFGSLLTAAEIAAWRDRTLNGFTGADAETTVEPAYITGEMLAAFIERAAEMAAAHLRRWQRRAR
jgi:hypothetical protein